jgi:hypothetical protein
MIIRSSEKYVDQFLKESGGGDTTGNRELYRDPDVVCEFKCRRIRWDGYVYRRERVISQNKLFDKSRRETTKRKASSKVVVTSEGRSGKSGRVRGRHGG